VPSLTVVNTSPLIFLSKAGYLELLRVLSAEIFGNVKANGNVFV